MRESPHCISGTFTLLSLVTCLDISVRCSGRVRQCDTVLICQCASEAVDDASKAVRCERGNARVRQCASVLAKAVC